MIVSSALRQQPAFVREIEAAVYAFEPLGKDLHLRPFEMQEGESFALFLERGPQLFPFFLERLVSVDAGGAELGEPAPGGVTVRTFLDPLVGDEMRSGCRGAGQVGLFRRVFAELDEGRPWGEL